MRHLSRRTNRRGFTLIELLLVLVILAVLAGIVVVNFSSVTKTSNDAKAKSDISNLETALELYKTNVGDYPASLDALVTNPGAAGWVGPYVKKGLPMDPWNHPYVYAYPGSHHSDSFDLSSAGDAKGTAVGLDNWTAAGATK